MAEFSESIAKPLGDRLRVFVDPNWQYLNVWSRPDYGTPGEVGDSLSFAFVDLEGGVGEDASPNYGDIDVTGRAEGYKTWINTSNREVSLTFRLHVQEDAPPRRALVRTSGGLTLQPVSDLREALLRQVKMPALWLESLKYPVMADDGLSHAPPPVYLQLGELLLLRSVVTAAQTTWEEPFDPDTMLPHGASVQVTFTAVTTGYRGVELRGPNRFRGSRAGGIAAAQATRRLVRRVIGG